MKRLMAISLAVIGALTLLSGVSGDEGKPKPKAKSITGELSKVESGSITVTVSGDGGAKTATFALANATKIMIETDKDETTKVKTEGGGEKDITKPVLKAGTAGDLKMGLRVTVSSADEKTADEILVKRAVKKKEEKDK